MKILIHSQKSGLKTPIIKNLDQKNLNQKYLDQKTWTKKIWTKKIWTKKIWTKNLDQKSKSSKKIKENDSNLRFVLSTVSIKPDFRFAKDKIISANFVFHKLTD